MTFLERTCIPKSNSPKQLKIVNSEAGTRDATHNATAQYVKNHVASFAQALRTCLRRVPMLLIFSTCSPFEYFNGDAKRVSKVVEVGIERWLYKSMGFPAPPRAISQIPWTRN